MPVLQDFLGSYRNREAQMQAAPMQELQQVGALQGILAQAQKQKAAQAEMQDQQMMKSAVQQTGGDPQAAIQKLLATGHPKAIELATKMQAAFAKPQGQSIGSGGLRLPDGTIVPPAARPGQQAGSGLSRLLTEKAALPQGDPRHEAYANAIRKESETAKQISPTIVMPKTDKVPMGYRLTANGNLEPIPGGPADTKIQGALNQDTSTLNESQSGMDRLQAEANRLLNHPGLSKTTGIMSIVPLAGGLATVPGTEAANFKAGLENLKSQVGFSVLQQMRNNSKSGGALGQISDRENILLQNNLAALDRAQSEDEFKAALGRIVQYTEGAKNRLRNAYNIKHGGRQATTPAPETREFATEADAIKSGVKGDVIIGGRKAKID